MFSFFKKKKIVDESKNNQITEMLANYALGLLENGKDFHNYDGIKCSFGYCISGVDGQLESIYKIETDMCVAYFQAIHGKVIRLSIDEEKYLWAVEYFYNNNPNLKKEINWNI